MTGRKRSGSGSKRPLKEKVVQIYETFFKGEDPSNNNPNFWDELFLLKPNVGALESEILKLNEEQLVHLKDNINLLFKQCIETLGHELNIRVIYAIQTLCALIDSVYKKLTGEFGFDIINILMGFDEADKLMQRLLDQCCTFLTGEYPPSLKGLTLKLFLVLITGTENVSQNTLLEYVMVNSIFEALVQLLSYSNIRLIHGHDAVLLITLLVNYRKHESTNPYIVKLSILDSELALNGYGQVITSSLSEFCRQFARTSSSSLDNGAIHSGHSSVGGGSGGHGWFSSLTNIVGSIFVSEDGGAKTTRLRANNAVLVALYETVHLNRNFITTMAHAQTEDSTELIPVGSMNEAQTETPVGTPEAPPGNMPPIIPNSVLPGQDVYAQPSNLLVTFFQYCSIAMQDTKSEASVNTVKLCFLVLTCISEDQYANSLMHDANLLFKVQLHRVQMRHRKSPSGVAQPLAATLLNLLSEFIMSHIMKKLPMELCLLCIGVAHRVLCYQKRSRVRINYQWKELWTALITLLKFLLANESHLAKKMNIFNLALQVVNIFNLFITYGDTFLPSPSSYDELYYELIRMDQVFENLYLMALRYSSNDGEYKESALRLTNSLINVRAIINHFNPKIKDWLSSQGVSTPTEEQILEVVRKNYDSLTLKLQDSLDQYERYSEKPKHSAFFTSMVRCVVNDTKQNIDFATLDVQLTLQEFSSLS